MYQKQKQVSRQWIGQIFTVPKPVQSQIGSKATNFTGFLGISETTCNSFVPCPTAIHANTSSLNFYGPDALPDAQPTVSAHGCIPEVAQSSFAEAKVGMSRLPGTNR